MLDELPRRLPSIDPECFAKISEQPWHVERVLYPTYAAVPRVWGISALDDQAAAGAIMWVPGSVIFLVPVVVIAIRLLDPARTRSAREKSNFNHEGPSAAEPQPKVGISRAKTPRPQRWRTENSKH